jgi:dipeptidyl aminopeptidase/acylaminoacyl peptidase
VLNPFTKEQEEFLLEGLPSYLDYQPGMNGSYLFAHSNLMSDSTLKRLVYPAVIENQFTTILWDVENKKELASLRLYLDQWFNDPLWSLDGENFLIMGFDDEEHVEWFQINRNGGVQQVTYFGEFLNNYKIEKPSRSWDGRYLAFQLFYAAGGSENVKYIVLDLKAPSLEGFCIDVISNQGDGAPVWSPDNRYLAITDGDTGISSRVLLVDIVDQEVFQIGEDVDSIGWIPKP